MTEVGEIIFVSAGRGLERVVERVPIHEAASGKLLYYALRTEPLTPEEQPTGNQPAP